MHCVFCMLRRRWWLPVIAAQWSAIAILTVQLEAKPRLSATCSKEPSE